MSDDSTENRPEYVEDVRRVLLQPIADCTNHMRISLPYPHVLKHLFKFLKFGKSFLTECRILRSEKFSPNHSEPFNIISIQGGIESIEHYTIESDVLSMPKLDRGGSGAALDSPLNSSYLPDSVINVSSAQAIESLAHLLEKEYCQYSTDSIAVQSRGLA